MGRLPFALITVSIIALLVTGITVFVLFLRDKPEPPRQIVTNNVVSAVDLPQDQVVSAWIWEYPTQINKNISSMLAFAKKEGINTIYINVDEYIDIYEMRDSEKKTQRFSEYNQALKDIVLLAKQNNIKVHALAGNPAYGYDSHEYIPPLLLEHIYEFNKNNPDSIIEGMQFDIEFYDDPRFSDSDKEYTQGFLKIVDNLINKTIEFNSKYSQNVRLGFIIPFWFDKSLPYVEKPILESMIESLKRLPDPYLIIMAYRNELDGEEGVYSLSKKELEMTSNTPIKILIALELVDNEDKSITLFGKSRDQIKQILKSILTAEKRYANFEGVTIHDLIALMATQ